MKSTDGILVGRPSCHTFYVRQRQAARADSTDRHTLGYRNESRNSYRVRADLENVPAPLTAQRSRRRNGNIYALAVCVTLALAASAADAATAPRRAGLMKLCPPGGESFASAWQMACGMRRRKKRDTEGANNGTEVVKAGQHEALQAIVGLAISDPEPLAKNRAGDIEAANAARRKRAVANAPDSHYYAYSSSEHDGNSVESRHYEPFAPSHKNGGGGAAALVLGPGPVNVGLNLLGGKKPPVGPSNARPNGSSGGQMIPSEMAELLAELNGDSAKLDEAAADEAAAEFRAPSISEVMMVCCRYGCSLRDLLPYCSPFGDWDSYY